MSLLKAPRPSLLRFCHEKEAVAALEFALVVPFLMTLMAGVYEVSRAVDSARRLTTLTNTASTMLATNTTGTVSYLDLHYAFDSAMVVFPTVLSDSFGKGISWSSDISISMAGITFTPTPSSCTSNCTYKANVVWTGGTAQRACNAQITSASDSASPTPTTLPSDLYDTVSTPSGTQQPPFTIVVDVSYTWTPLIFSTIMKPLGFGQITFKRSAYINPRYVSQITYSVITGDDKFGKECPGY